MILKLGSTGEEVTKHAMAIGTAGFTALLCSFAVQARETILLGEKVKAINLKLAIKLF